MDLFSAVGFFTRNDLYLFYTPTLSGVERVETNLLSTTTRVILAYGIASPFHSKLGKASNKKICLASHQNVTNPRIK